MLASGGTDELWRLVAPVAVALFVALRQWKKTKTTPRKAPPPTAPKTRAAPSRPTTFTSGQLEVPVQLPTSATPFPGAAPAPRPQPPAVPAAPRKNQTLNLDAGQFAPISDAQAKQQASAAGNLLRNLQFGLQSRIPPV